MHGHLEIGIINYSRLDVSVLLLIQGNSKDCKAPNGVCF